MENVFEPLRARWPRNGWLASVCEQAEAKLRHQNHGDYPRWNRALQSLPDTPVRVSLDQPSPELGACHGHPEQLRSLLMELHPWRKGPLRLGGVKIDSEWRSDWKWERVAPHIELEGRRVLDIGCGNGYFGLRMLGAGARLVIGIDPTLLYYMQWRACRHFSGDIPNYLLPLGVEDLPAGPAGVDAVFSMGVLYHRKNPQHHLARLHSLLDKKGSTLVLETLVLPTGRGDSLLIPRERYARMRNVWAIPGVGRLEKWIRTAGFNKTRVVDVTATGTGEQRSTEWMRFESLDKALDPEDPSKTVEGYPAPVRALVIAEK